MKTTVRKASLLVLLVWGVAWACTSTPEPTAEVVEVKTVEVIAEPEVVETEPVPAPGPVAAPLERPAKKATGRWVLVKKPQYGRFNRLLGYETVRVWQPAQRQTTFGRTFGNCPSGSCPQ